MRAFAPGSFAPPQAGCPTTRSRGTSFATEAGVVADRLQEPVEQVQTAGGEASMGMLGETVFAVDVEGVLPQATQVDPTGARLLAD